MSLEGNPCLSPEELAVVELIYARHRELDQREELLVLQEQALEARRLEVQGEMTELRALRAELQTLIEKQAGARAERTEALVDMVNQMRPGDAAEMLTAMEPVLAAAVLQRLSPRQAGKTLGKMDPVLAADIGGSMAVDPIEVSLAGEKAEEKQP